VKGYIEQKSGRSKVKIALAQMDVIPNKAKRKFRENVKNG
jgi:hypothetical protein